MQTLSFIELHDVLLVLGILGQAAIILWIIRDRRRRREAECTLRSGEERLSSILENLPLPVRVSRRDGSIEFVNKAFHDSYGYDLEDIPTLDHWWRAAYPDQPRRMDAQLDWTAWQGRIDDAEPASLVPRRVIRCKDGSCRTAELTTASLGSREILVLTDITERLGYETELQASERRLKTILANTNAIIYQLDRDGTFLLSDGLALAALGLGPGEVVGRNAFEIYAGNGHVLESLRRALAGHRGDCLVQVGGRRFRNLTTPLVDGEGRTASMIGVATDVTELIEAQERLAASEERFHSLFQALREGVALYEIPVGDGPPTDYRLLDANPAYERILGIGREAAIGSLASNLYGQTPAPHVELFAEVAAGGDPVQFETFFAPMGRHFSISTVSPRRGQFVTVFEDITEKKRIQAEIGRNEQRFRAIFENTAVGLALVDKAGRCTEANARFLAMVGSTREELLGRSVFDLTHPDDRAVSRVEMAEAYGRPDPASYELVKRYLRSDGSSFWGLLNVTVLTDPESGEKSCFGLVVDIDARVRAEQALTASKERLALAMEATSDGLWDANLATGEEFVSPRWFRMLGYEPGEAPRKDPAWLFCIHPDDRQQAYDKQLGDILAGRPIDNEFRMIAKDGSVRWIHRRGKIVERDVRGMPVRVLGTNSDVTERKRVEERYRILFESAKDAIFVLKDGRIDDLNQAATTMYGLGRDELIGLSPLDLSAPCQPDGRESALVAQEILDRAEHEETLMFEWQHRRRDGSEFPGEIVLTRMDLFGERYSLVFARDITTRRRMQDIMVQSEKMLSLGGLAAGLAHEINNPLGIVHQGTLSILRRIDPDVPANAEAAARLGLDMAAAQAYFKERNILRYLQGVHEAGERATAIVANMLSFSRRGDSAKRMCDLHGIIDRSLDIAASDYGLKTLGFGQVRIVRAYDAVLPQVPCSATEIEQVILNLVRNAVQAMASSGTLAPELTLRTRREGRQVRIELEDNGPGVPPDKLYRIFEPFYTSKGVGEGTGLGLSVSYYIVTTNHHGQIFAEQAPGRGARFVIRLPVAAAGAGPAERRAGGAAGRMMGVSTGRQGGSRPGQTHGRPD